MPLHQFIVLLAGIVLVDLLLSGDNAVVIALVCRQLPRPQQRMGMVLGTCAAILLRVVMSFFAAWLISVPGLRVAGALLLAYVAVGMVREDGGADEARAATSLLRAVVLIGLADASMSLDNVIALAGLAHGNLLLMVLGVALSIPLVIVGAEVIRRVVDHAPWLVWAGAALLGWVAGGIAATDPWLLRHVDVPADKLYYGLSAGFLALVILVGLAVAPLGDGEQQA